MAKSSKQPPIQIPKQDWCSQGVENHGQGEADGEETREEVEPILTDVQAVIPGTNVTVQQAEAAYQSAHVGSMDYRVEPESGPYTPEPFPTPKFDTRWVGKVNGITYRVIVYRAFSFHPERISLERMISQGDEPDTWTEEVMPQ